MEWKKREQSYSEYLDAEKENKLFVRFVFNLDYSAVESFAVIYLTAVKEEFREVVRFDANSVDPVNIHQFYYKPPKKRYLNKPINWETIEELVDTIRKNWHSYRSEYRETINL